MGVLAASTDSPLLVEPMVELLFSDVLRVSEGTGEEAYSGELLALASAA
jgi:hypothetical protein